MIFEMNLGEDLSVATKSGGVITVPDALSGTHEEFATRSEIALSGVSDSPNEQIKLNLVNKVLSASINPGAVGESEIGDGSVGSSKLGLEDEVTGERYTLAVINERLVLRQLTNNRTVFTFADFNVEKRLIGGELNRNDLVELGMVDASEGTWSKTPVKVEVGESVTGIAPDTFSGNNALFSVVFSNRTTEDVRGMSGFSWGLPTGCTITCTNGTVTL